MRYRRKRHRVDDKLPKELADELRFIARVEAGRAQKWQRTAGISAPIKLGFRTRELTGELKVAAQKLWDIGTLDDQGRVDPVARQLWQQVNRGTSCLTESDFIEFSQLPPAEMRALCGRLIQGQTLEQVLWSTRKTRKTPSLWTSQS